MKVSIWFNILQKEEVLKMYEDGQLLAKCPWFKIAHINCYESEVVEREGVQVCGYATNLIAYYRVMYKLGDCYKGFKIGW